MSASSYQRTGSLGSAMRFVLLPHKIFDVHFSALSGIERTNTLIDFTPELAELLDMGKQSAADLFLIGIRQICDFR